MNQKIFGICILALALLPSCKEEDSCTARLSEFISADKTHSESIVECFASVSDCDERTIIFDVPELLIDRVILLPSNTELILEDCCIKQADYMYDNIFRGSNLPVSNCIADSLPEKISPIHDIKITGKGMCCLTGPDKHRMGTHHKRGYMEMVGDEFGALTHFINLSMADKVEVSGLSLKKTNGWAICFDLCTNVSIHDMDFETNVEDGDGIDFRCGCKGFEVWNIQGSTSDDIVACTALGDTNWVDSEMAKILYSDVFCRKMYKSLKEQDNDALDIENGSIKNIISTGTHKDGWGHGVIVLSAYGSKVKNIEIENILEGSAGVERESLIKIYTGFGSGYTPGDISNISVRNVSANTAKFALYSNAECENVLLENVRHEFSDERAMKIDHPEGFIIR